MSKFLDCIKPKPCEPEEKEPLSPPATPEFDACMGDYTMHWDGKRATIERTRNTPDGTYTQVTVENGCITSFGYAPEPTYTPPFCAALPEPCGEGGAGDINISAASGNLINRTSEGLFARVYAQGEGGVNISGTGTQTDPLRVSMNTSGGAGNKVVGSDVILVQALGDGVDTVSLQPSGVQAGDYSWHDILSVDNYGRVIRAEENPEEPIKAGPGIELEKDGQSYTIGHRIRPYNETDAVDVGTARLYFDSTGHFDRSNPVNFASAGQYKLGGGSITINENGLVTNVEEDKGTETSTYAFPDDEPEFTFIRDMYRIEGDGKGFMLESYGIPLTMTYQNDTISMILPGYVELDGQVQVNGGGEWTFNPGNGQLNIKANSDYKGVITVTLRW